MYISNVKNCNFFFSRFFLKKRREKIFFQEKTLKKKEAVEIPFSSLSLPPSPPVPLREVN